MSETVLDASALLALLNDEAGADVVAAVFPNVVISAVNLSEVVAKLCGAGMPEKSIRQAIEPLGLEIISFDKEQSYQAGLLHGTTRNMGISFGDRACLNLGKRLGAITLTADKTWANISTEAAVKVKVIR